MTLIETRLRVERCVQAISAPLYEGIASGYAEAEARLGTLTRIEEYPSLTPMVARAGMRNYWLDHGLGLEWRVGGNPRLSVQTTLYNHSEGLELRLLKERSRRYPGGVPVAGSNHARRQVWMGEQLGLEVPGLPAARTHRCLLLWDRLLTEGGDPQLTVRVVHPIGTGVWGNRVPIDMSFEINPGGGMFDTLSFPGDPQLDDFFPNITREDNDEAASDQ